MKFHCAHDLITGNPLLPIRVPGRARGVHLQLGTFRERLQVTNSEWEWKWKWEWEWELELEWELQRRVRDSIKRSSFMPINNAGAVSSLAHRHYKQLDQSNLSIIGFHIWKVFLPKAGHLQIYLGTKFRIKSLIFVRYKKTTACRNCERILLNIISK